MRLRIARMAAGLAAVLILTARATGGVPTTMQSPPNPVLMFLGQEYYETGGKQWTRYGYAVANSEAYPNELFAAAPDLPPCGQNTRAARTWVDIYAQDGKRLNGFCALTNRDGLGQLWFALESGVIPPSWVYVEMVDRRTNSKYKSGLTETTL